MTYFWGVPGCVTKCDRGGGLKLAKNSTLWTVPMGAIERPAHSRAGQS